MSCLREIEEDQKNRISDYKDHEVLPADSLDGDRCDLHQHNNQAIYETNRARNHRGSSSHWQNPRDISVRESVDDDCIAHQKDKHGNHSQDAPDLDDVTHTFGQYVRETGIDGVEATDRAANIWWRNF